MDDFDVDAMMAGAMRAPTGLTNQMIGDSLGHDSHAYELVGFERVNALGAEGWEVVSVHKVSSAEFANGLAFFMHRKRGPADAAEEMTRQATGEGQA